MWILIISLIVLALVAATAGIIRNRKLQKKIDRGGIEILFPFHEGIEGRVYGKQQPLYFFIGFHRFPALAIQSALTRVP